MRLCLCIVRQTCWMRTHGASLTQRINQVARERNEVAIYEELLSKSNQSREIFLCPTLLKLTKLYARRLDNRADNVDLDMC